MYKQITVQTLHQQGVKNAEIAKTLGCHRNTVRKILQRNTIIEKQTRIKPSVFDTRKETIKAWLDQDITKLRIHEKLKEEYGIHSSYVNLCIYINKQFPKFVEAFGVQQTAPGEEAELDFGYLGMLPGLNGKPVKTWGLVVVLAYSRVGYYAICYDQKLETLIRELTNAFSYFGGVTLRLKIDNMRTAILENQHYDLLMNQDFLEFANHYGTVIIPCTPYSPEQKGKVESGVKYLQQNFVNGRHFANSADLQRQLRNWMDTYANQRVHGTTKKVPSTVLQQEEKAKLLPLPAESFAFFNRSTRKVAPNCHIHFENNYYSVPFSLVRKEVTVRWNEAIVRIVSNGEQIALHAKATGEGNYVTVRSHLPDYKIYSENERQVKYETKMREIGEDAHEYFRWLLAQKENYWFVIVRGILGLKETYGNEAVNLSLKRAFCYQVRNVVTIRHILEKKLYLKAVEPKLLDTEKTIFQWEDNPLCRDL
jgi:transposase